MENMMALTFSCNRLARVPEHSPGLMAGLSGGTVHVAGSHLFFHTHETDGTPSLIAIGYPLRGQYDAQTFASRLRAVMAESNITSCWSIAPALPGGAAQGLTVSNTTRDRYWLLPASAPVPAKLRGPLRQAAKALRVDMTTVFTLAHKALWEEFTGSKSGSMTVNVAALYAGTPKLMGGDTGHAPDGVYLLNAWVKGDTEEGEHLAACLLVDTAPTRFLSYIVGAHSRLHYVPHATDLLFSHMLELARTQGKHFVHLGLGVNEGILRFKRKWGAMPGHVYEQGQVTRSGAAENINVRALSLTMLDASARNAHAVSHADPRPYALLWQVEKAGKISWLGGTAHFFCHSFAPSFRSLYRRVDKVLFEGPLDATFMAQATSLGRQLPQCATPLADMLDEDDIVRLEHMVYGLQGRLWQALNMATPRRVDIRHLLHHARYWYAFFSIWTAFLERMGWRQSVDMEAWQVAQDMGKQIIAMENLKEQMDSLNSLPAERVVRFFRNCGGWPARARHNRRAYLAGDLEGLMGTSAEFPTRTEHIISNRDQRFCERMLPHMEQGRAVAFVGAAHLVNLRHLLADAGFTVRQRPFGLVNKLRCHWRGGDGITW